MSDSGWEASRRTPSGIPPCGSDRYSADPGRGHDPPAKSRRIQIDFAVRQGWLPQRVERPSHYQRRIEDFDFDFDFDFQPSVDRKLVEDLASLRFITEQRPVLFL